LAQAILAQGQGFEEIDFLRRAMMRPGPYGKWVGQDPKQEALPRERVKLRIFCAPSAGMGGWCFHGWMKPGALPDDVEVMPLELPARGARLGEPVPFAKSVPDLAQQVLEGLGQQLLSDVPYVLFGHSFGAWLVYEMTQEISRRGWPLPLKLYVSGMRAPQLAGAQHDADTITPSLSGLSASEFWPAFERRYGRNPDLAAPEIRRFVYNLLQADFTLLETYTPSTLRRLVAIPLCAVCAYGDERCLPVQLKAWGERAGEDFSECWFDGTPPDGSWANEHRYILDNPDDLFRFLRKDLTGLLNRHPEEKFGKRLSSKVWSRAKKSCTIL